MPVFISLLRGINVGGNKMIKMDALKALYGSLGLEGARTLLQSGNVVFTAKAPDGTRLARRISDGISSDFGMEVEVIVRSLPQWRDVMARNPFAHRDFNPSRLLVMFLARAPDVGGLKRLGEMDVAPEEVIAGRQELYIHYADGIARSKLGKVPIETLLKTQGTARNWNTVTKLLALAQDMEKG